MMEGCAAGVLISGTDTSNYFNGVTQPVTFLAADSLENDEETVKIGVGVVEQNPLARMQTKGNVRTQTKNRFKDKKNADAKDDEISIDAIIIGSCFGGDFYSDKRSDENVIVKGEPFKIDWDAITHQINTVPEMQKLLTIWLTPKNYIGPYTIDWELEVKWVSKEQSPDKTFKYTFRNHKTSTEPNGTDLPLSDTDNTIIGGDEITLTVNEFFYAGKSNLLKKPITKKITGMKILGSNPDKEVIKEYVSNCNFSQLIDLPLSEVVSGQDRILQMQILTMKESTWFQFKDERDEYHNYPADEWGYNNMNPNPHDWGLCQLSIAEPSLGVIWNWKENINAGIDHMWSKKYPIAKRLFRDIKKKFRDEEIVIRDPNRKEFLTMLAQLYKGGAYYDSFKFTKGTSGEYYRKKDKKNVDYGYGDDFWKKFDDVYNGTPYPEATAW